MASRKIRMIIESDLNDIPLVGVAVNRFCSYADFSETDAFNIELCVIEAVTNSIKHAYKEKAGQEVLITFTLLDHDVVFEISDKGSPMDPELLNQADLLTSYCENGGIDAVAECGRGLGIMKEIMDEVVYRSENGVNCLTLRKHIS